MQNFRRQSVTAQRFAERRQREDSAPRLSSEVPGLVSLCLAIEESSDATTVSRPKHLRRIVVERAPALFLVPCGDPRCTDGGHDVTSEIMGALLKRQTTFRGESKCNGYLAASPCTRILRYDAIAEYS
jgi:hypothetical protein